MPPPPINMVNMILIIIIQWGCVKPFTDGMEMENYGFAYPDPNMFARGIPSSASCHFEEIYAHASSGLLAVLLMITDIFSVIGRNFVILTI